MQIFNSSSMRHTSGGLFKLQKKKRESEREGEAEREERRKKEVALKKLFKSHFNRWNQLQKVLF